MTKSVYDQLHDEYLADGGGKAGTRYERLMSLVLAVLNREASIVHDIRLRGDTGVAHQIDVRLTRGDGKERHILVECKDFEVSGDAVGLSIIRDFWGVVDDVKPTEAWVVTCTGFTREAQKYARGKGIKLAILRVFQEKDWGDRFRTIEITGQLRIPTEFQSHIRFKMKDKERLEAVSALKKTTGTKSSAVVVILQDGTRYQINNYLEQKMNTGTPKEIQDNRFEVDAFEIGMRIQYGDAEPFDPDAMNVTYALHESEPIKITITTANQIARLLLAPITEETDYVILDSDLKEFTIDAVTGEVRPKP